jgi:hypothetical protein
MKGEHRREEKLTVGVLKEDGRFPEPMPDLIPTIDVEFDRLELISKLTDFDALGLNKATVSVSALQPCICIMMHRIDFCRVMTTDMYKSLQSESSLYSIKPKPLQLEWVTRVDWEKEKRQVVNQIMNNAHSVKRERVIAMQQWRNGNENK